MSGLTNPFRPGAGHQPPYLAGRRAEQREFARLLGQETILENIVLTGLRGVGKTVLLESLKPLAIEKGWLWIGADLNESASISEDHIAIRLCTDLAPSTSAIVMSTKRFRAPGFTAGEETVERTLTYQALENIYSGTPTRSRLFWKRHGPPFRARTSFAEWSSHMTRPKILLTIPKKNSSPSRFSWIRFSPFKEKDSR